MSKDYKDQANLKSQEEQDFEKYLERIEDPKNEREVNRDLPVKNSKPYSALTPVLSSALVDHL